MKIIRSLQEFDTMQIGEKVYFVNDGNVSPYVFNGFNCKTKYPIFVNDYNWIKTEDLNWVIKTFAMSRVLVRGKYNPKQIGLLMTHQLQKHIKSIREIYLK